MGGYQGDIGWTGDRGLTPDEVRRLQTQIPILTTGVNPEYHQEDGLHQPKVKIIFSLLSTTLIWTEQELIQIWPERFDVDSITYVELWKEPDPRDRGMPFRRPRPSSDLDGKRSLPKERGNQELKE